METQREQEQEFKDQTLSYKEKQFQLFLSLKLALQQLAHKKIVHKILQNIIKNPKFQIHYGWQQITPDFLQFLSNQTSVLSTKLISNIDINFDSCDIKSESSKQFGSFLTALKPVHILDFNIYNNGNFGTKGTQSLKQGLKNQTELKVLKLNIGEMKLEDKGIKLIFEAISKIVNLRDIDLYLASNHISELGISYLAEMLETLLNLEKINLNFQYSQFNSQIIQPIWEGFTKQKNLKELKVDLQENLIESDGIKGLERALKIQTNLRVLDLDLGLNQELCTKSCEYLSSGLKNLTSLEVFRLSLWRTKINEKGLQILGQALNNSKNLSELSLNLSEIRNSQGGLRLFFDELKSIKKLQNLTLNYNENNEINELDMKSMSQFLALQQNLEKLKLELSNSGIKAGEFFILMENLTKLSKLKRLTIVLNSNNLEPKIWQAFKQNLPKLINLQFLWIGLYRADLNNEGIKQLGDGVSLLPELEELGLDILHNNEIEGSSVKYMLSKLENLPKIKLINISLGRLLLASLENFMENSSIKKITTLY